MIIPESQLKYECSYNFIKFLDSVERHFKCQLTLKI